LWPIAPVIVQIKGDRANVCKLMHGSARITGC
jgi:hypothetical protein